MIQNIQPIIEPLFPLPSLLRENTAPKLSSSKTTQDRFFSVFSSAKKFPSRKLLTAAAVFCSSHTDCSKNHYCVSCSYCQANSGDPASACRECLESSRPASSAGFCKPVRYCKTGLDAVSGSCPAAITGCAVHADCDQFGGSARTSFRGEEEYCVDCAQCLGTARNCYPCGSSALAPGKGMCGKRSLCPTDGDPINGACPKMRGCAGHGECGQGEYCRSCEKCLESNHPTYCRI